MRKLWFALLAMTAMSGMFTSCDDDEKLAMELSGDWHGTFYCTYQYYVGQEKTPRQAWSDETYMTFIPNHLFGSTRGTGYELDIFNSGPVDYMYYEFDWKISDETIILEYFDNPDMNCTIYDYRLTHATFKGYFGVNKNSFDLKNMDVYDWSPYQEGVHYRDGVEGRWDRTYVRSGDEEVEIKMGPVRHEKPDFLND